MELRARARQDIVDSRWSSEISREERTFLTVDSPRARVRDCPGTVIRTSPETLMARAIMTALRFAVRLLFYFVASRARLAVENLALRQQLVVYKRKRPRPSLRNRDRLFWARGLGIGDCGLRIRRPSSKVTSPSMGSWWPTPFAVGCTMTTGRLLRPALQTALTAVAPRSKSVRSVETAVKSLSWCSVRFVKPPSPSPFQPVSAPSFLDCRARTNYCGARQRTTCAGGPSRRSPVRCAWLWTCRTRGW